MALRPTFVSAAQLWDRSDGNPVGTDEWVMDSGAFTEITTHGGYRFPEEDYAALIRRHSRERGSWPRWRRTTCARKPSSGSPG